MSAPVFHKIFDNTFWLSPNRCIFWEEENILIVSDLHFGKTGHFRKEGIAVPQNIFKEDLQRLFTQIQFYKPKKIIITGDLFHSRENSEMKLFLKWRNDIAGIPVVLVKGNHDILKDEWYETAGLDVYHEQLITGRFIFTHDINAAAAMPEGHYFFSGHIHPGVRIRNASRQSLCFPCYYFSRQFAVLPAFSKFTGLAMMRVKKEDKVFAIVNQSVIAIR